MRLSEHFMLQEMVFSDYAIRQGLENTPDLIQIANLKMLSECVLEPLRKLAGVPIRVTSGYRSPEVNRAIGGSSQSQHMRGEAADVVPTGISLHKLWDHLTTSDIEFDQAIWEFDRWIHVSYRHGRNRGETLRAYRKDGKTIYERSA